MVGSGRCGLLDGRLALVTGAACGYRRRRAMLEGVGQGLQCVCECARARARARVRVSACAYYIVVEELEGLQEGIIGIP